jgi:hypothetical protein
MSETSDRERAIIWSYGGGVQSAAIACLVVDGRLPRPERIVMADTGREATATWEWLDRAIQPMLATVGLKVEIAPHSLACVDLYANTPGHLPLIPAFSSDAGRLPNFCSVEWKRRVVHRWLREKGYGPNRPIREWLGISTDESHRARHSDVEWVEYAYPLMFDIPLRRSECVQIVRGAGLGTPPRSSCWMCPFRTNRGWELLKTSDDGDWSKATALDEEIRPLGLALHRSFIPLREVVFGGEAKQGAFDFCEEGRCEF